MKRALHHARQNAVAYLALFVALGGTGYAAVNLPTNSVGARQIKNHSITPVKLDPRSIGASVRYWADIEATGRVIASKPRAMTSGWGAGAGNITWGHRIPSDCYALATADVVGTPGGFQGGSVSTLVDGSRVSVLTFNPDGAPNAKHVHLAVLCP